MKRLIISLALLVAGVAGAGAQEIRSMVLWFFEVSANLAMGEVPGLRLLQRAPAGYVRTGEMATAGASRILLMAARVL